MKWFKIEGLSYTAQPFIKRISVNSKSICLVGYEGDIFALSAKCPHAGEDLSRGWCTDDGKLVCPIHRFSYSLTNGRGSTGQNDYVDTYVVKIKEDAIYVGFETFKERLIKLFK